MREIRFRAWIKNDRRMIEWFPQFFADTSPVTSYGDDFPENDDNVVLMQYTGLKDKNGVEIYEGDIILVNGIGQCTIVYGCHCIGKDDYGIEHCTFSFSGEWEDGSGHYGIQDSEGITIIGNIYEHPDLLK